MSRYLWLTFCAVAISGCVNAPRIEIPVSIIDRPSMNQAANAELGATILEQGRYRVSDALIARNDIVWDMGPLRVKVTIPSGILIAEQRDAEFTYYFSNRTTARDPLTGEALAWQRNAALRIRIDNFSDVRGVALPTGESFLISPAPILERTRIPLLDATGFRKELVYGGRSGDILKFQYREVSGNAVQPRINQDIEWNLHDGMVVSFKGAKIEVLDATNARLSYEVRSSFTDETPGQ